MFNFLIIKLKFTYTIDNNDIKFDLGLGFSI
jgi:hypothetical protein